MTPRLFFLLSTAHRATQRYAGKVSSPGLSGAQAGVLFLLSRSNSLPIGALAKGLETNPSSMTELIDRMVVAGLVERSADAEDGRSQRLRLTVAGEVARRGAVASLSELNLMMTQGFSKDDIDIVARWLEAVRVRFVDAADLPHDEHQRSMKLLRPA